MKSNASSRASVFPDMNMELYKKIVQNTAILLTKMHVTADPFLLTLDGHSGVFEGTFRNHVTNSQILALKQMSMEVYMKVCGMHMVGSGMYMCYLQEKLKKSASDFAFDEVKSIARAWENTDAYELALKTFGILQQSQQKASLDQI